MILLKRVAFFLWRVVTAFLKNHGVLLAGGVGYNVLLSLVPFFAVFVTLLSYVVDQESLLKAVSAELNHLVPAHDTAIIETLRDFLDQRQVFGWLGFGVLLFFGTIAVRILEQAVSLIFEGLGSVRKHRWWFSPLRPYLMLCVFGLLLLAVSLLQNLFDVLRASSLTLPGLELPLAGISVVIVRVCSFFVLVAVFVGLYRKVPSIRVSWRRATVGALVAATLWSVLANVMSYYFDNISLVNVIYGSLATVIVILLFMEAASIILLLGAQVIAELERSAAANVPWYERPPTVQEAAPCPQGGGRTRTGPE